jgi:hypothetical protein
MKNFEYQGVWWTEGHSDKVRGTLSFFGRDRAILNLDNDFPSSGEVKMVWGITDTGRPITLVGCVKTGVLLFSLTGFSPAKYKVSEVYVGAHFSEKGEITFRTIYVCFNYLSQWVNISGLTYQIKTNEEKHFQGYEITYTLPEKKIVALPDGGQLSFSFGVNFSPDAFETRISQEAGIELVSPERLSLREWLIKYVSPLQDLLSLATLRPNSITELWTTLPPDEQNNSRRVSLFFHPIFHDEDVPIKLGSHDFLFRLEDISEYLQDVFSNWLKTEDDLGIVRNIFFGIDYQNHTYLDAKFINIAQSAEIYHRRRHNNEVLPKSQWKDLLNRLRSVSVLSEEQKRWINDRIAFGNEPRLRERVRELLDETDDVLNKLVGDKDAFAKKVTDTRNYFTHYSTGLKNKAATGEELYWLTEVLIMMMQRCFLKELGIPSEKCIELFRRIPRYHAIKAYTRSFPWSSTDLSEI